MYPIWETIRIARLSLAQFLRWGFLPGSFRFFYGAFSIFFGNSLRRFHDLYLGGFNDVFLRDRLIRGRGGFEVFFRGTRPIRDHPAVLDKQGCGNIAETFVADLHIAAGLVARRLRLRRDGYLALSLIDSDCTVEGIARSARLPAAERDRFQGNAAIGAEYICFSDFLAAFVTKGHYFNCI